MDRTQLIDTFRVTASEIAERDFSHVDDQVSIQTLGLDSLAMLELIGTFERTLSIRIPDEELGDIHTVGQLLQLVEHKLEAAR